MLLYPISVSGGYCSNSVSTDSVNYSHADDVAVLQSQTVFGVNLRASQCVSQDSPHLPPNSVCAKSKHVSAADGQVW